MHDTEQPRIHSLATMRVCSFEFSKRLDHLVEEADLLLMNSEELTPSQVVRINRVVVRLNRVAQGIRRVTSQ